MKKTSLRYWFAMLLILLLASFFVVSCKAKKQPETTHTIERIIEMRNDTISQKEISKAITDSLFLKIQEIKSSKPECDSIINAEIKKLLQQIASKKQSGDNQLGFYYDELNNMLVAYGSISESINEKLKILESLKDKEKDKKVVEIPVEYIPKWVKYLAWIGGIFISFYTIKYGIKIYKIVFP